MYEVRRPGRLASPCCHHDILAEFDDLDDALDFAESRGGAVVRRSDGRWLSPQGWAEPVISPHSATSPH